MTRLTWLPGAALGRITLGPASSQWTTTKIAKPTTARNATSKVPTRTGRDISHHLASSQRLARTTRSGTAEINRRHRKQTTAPIVLLGRNTPQEIAARMTKLSSWAPPTEALPRPHATLSLVLAQASGLLGACQRPMGENVLSRTLYGLWAL